MRDKIKKNDGYTLVELIIVIAIIAVMSGAGVLTISTIKTAQATTSMQKFDSELSTLEMKTKTQSKDAAIYIEKDGANYNIYYGTCPDDDPLNFSPAFTQRSSTDPDTVLERVTIKYSSTYEDKDAAEVTGMMIKIRKSDGKVLSGAGEYIFCKYGSSDQTVGRIMLNGSTGGHTYGSN